MKYGKSVTFRLSSGDYNRLEEMAAAEGVSVSDVLRHLVTRQLEQEKVDKTISIVLEDAEIKELIKKKLKD